MGDFLRPETEADRCTRLLAAVQGVEGDGEVINDWYTFDQYKNARARFMSSHEDYKDRQAQFPSASLCAKEVFTSQPDQLSVQAVRRRELEQQIEPLLPFKTKSNTDSIDGYASYPDREWTPTWERPVPTFDFDDDPQDTVSDHTPQSPIDLEAAQDLPPGGRASSPAPTGFTDPITGARNVPDAAGMKKLLEDLARPRAPAKPSPCYRGEEGVAAVGARPIDVPVKSPAGKKRAASAMDDEDEELFDEPVPPRRRIATKAPRKAPMEVPAVNNVSDSKGSPEPPRPTKKLKLNASKKSASKKSKSAATKKPSSKKRAATPAPTTAVKPEDDALQARYAAIADGRRLPKSRLEATSGASLRHASLLASYQQTNPNPVPHPDLPKEFFSQQNFTAQERASVAAGEDGPIRCICGSEEEISNWIMCDGEGCHVWQHVDCMGKGVPGEDVRDEVDYLCQVCDPWGHRRLVQRLRREQGVFIGGKEKGGM